MSDSLNGFAIKLFNKLSKNENFFISPYSISTALTMCLQGAKSETAQQLKDLLNLTNMTNEDILKLNSELTTCINTRLGKDVVLNTANKIYPNKGFELEKNFVDAIEKNFHGEVEQLDYVQAAASAKTINDWVSGKTNEKIKNLVPEDSINSSIKLILVNAIYFKGNWLVKFNSAETVKEDFNCADGTKVKVDMMKLSGKKFRILDNVLGISGQACTFPYGGGIVAMTIFLPNENVSLSVMEKELTAEKLKEILEIEIGKDKVNVSLPKFKLEYSTELSENLKQLGATHAFDSTKADFTGINSVNDGLHISKVLHKAFIEVNEEGCEAAAATAVMMMKRCAFEEPHEFNCNRPFLFAIHDTVHNNVLFFGKYVKPT